MAWKYVNLTGGVISVPSPRGGQVQFRPGQFTTDKWFSRFAKPGKLSRMAMEAGDQETVNATIKKRRAKITRGQAKILSYLDLKDYEVIGEETPESKPQVEPSTSMLDRIEQAAEEETDYFKRVKGVFTCKLCGIFSTGGRDSLKYHLLSAHQVNLDALEAAAKVSEPEPAVEPELGSEPVVEPDTESTVEEPAVQPVDVPEGFDDTPAEAQQVEETPSEFVCPHCGKKYRTELYLNKHIAAKHAIEVE